MGNCVACHSQPKKQTKGPLIEGRELEVDASVPVEKMNTASSKRYIVVRRKVQPGEVYHLAPFLRQSGKPLVPCMATENRRLKARIVKIVVTTEQLELLLSGSKKFQIKSRVAPVREVLGCRDAQNGALPYQLFKRCRTFEWCGGCNSSFPFISCTTNFICSFCEVS